MVSAPRFETLQPASARASNAARGASRKRDTRCEIALRRALWSLGLRYRVDVPTMPGRPDIVFIRARVVVFCDGDFWHGRRLRARLARLAGGHNAAYWVEKIRSNVTRDRKNARLLRRDGWCVVRVWESDVKKNADAVANRIATLVRERQAS